jgi:phage shock protein PspC (stress-responsive transcriptional regulator)
MDKTININIAGTLFQIDDEAFRRLRDYLQAINNRFRNVQGGHETVEDIEFRIAEIFQSQKGLAGVVTKENVEAMISIIGKPEDFDVNETEPDHKVFNSQKKRMYRNPDDKIIGGVCSGLGAYLDTDPVLFRILFVLFTAFFGVGFFIYIVLWIALPDANTEAKKREMFGDSYHSASSRYKQKDGYYDSPSTRNSNQTTSALGNALNEIFRAIGRVCFVILRISLIIIGVILVITGALAILSFIMIFVFKFPGVYPHDTQGINLSYIPHFLNYIISPSVVPWIKFLATLVIVLPLLAIIYWGVKMVFWFKAKDGVFSLAGLVVWILSIAALSIILFNEGISYAEMGKSVSNNILNLSSDTLYIKPGKKIANLKYDHTIAIPHEGYDVYVEEEKQAIYVGTYLRIEQSDDKNSLLEIRKYSYGSNRTDASLKAEELRYNYTISGDTLFLDEYFTYPTGRKWSFDDLGVTLFIPEGTIINIDKNNETLIHPSWRGNFYSDSDNFNPNNGFWKWTNEGLRQTDQQKK